MDFVVGSCMYNGYYKGVMVTVKTGKHIVEMYDAIEELPIVRFHKYQKLLLVEAGIGSDLVALDQRIEKVRRYLMDNKPDKAEKELENLRQSVWMIQNSINPKHRAFAVLVAKIDGREYPDISDDSLQTIMETLNDVSEKDMTAQLEAVKKKN